MVAGRSLAQVLDGFWPGCAVAVKGYATLGPPERLAVVVLLLESDGHLPIRVEHRDLAPVVDASRADAVHLSVVVRADVVIVVQGGTEGLAAAVQGCFELRVDEVGFVLDYPDLWRAEAKS